MDSSTEIQGYIGKLPEELRHRICLLLPFPALKSLGLANKRWRKSSSSVLWKTFKSGLGESRIRNFESLLLSPPGGFLDNVRNLKIDTYGDVSQRVLQLIFVIPKNTLRTVKLPNLDAKTLGLLIRSQTLIEELKFRQLAQRHTYPNPRFLAGNLRKLRRLTITPPRNDDEYNVWLLNTPALDTLKIVPSVRLDPSLTRAESLPTLKTWKCPATFTPLRLRYICLSYLDLSDNPYNLEKVTHLPSLETLEINHCVNVSAFLQELSIEYSALDAPGLKSLSLLQSFDQSDVVTSLDLFIGSFSGLEMLFVATRDPQRVNVEDICRHGQTLRLLHLDSLYHPRRAPLSEANSFYTAAELELLLAGCPRIEELGIHASVIDINSIFLGASSLTPERKNFTETLDVIARFRLLRSLRFTHLLALKENTKLRESNVHAVRYNQLATEILRYLVERGSSIEVYATSPTVTPGDRIMSEDFQGHEWPHYYYVRGAMTSPFRGRTLTQTVAVAVKEEDMAGYVECPTILFRKETTENGGVW